jgi:hypothetical protein
VNNHPVKLKSVSLSEAPQVLLTKEHAEDPFLVSNTVFKPYLQIFVESKCVFNSIEKELKHNQLEFDLAKQNIIFENDFLIRIRHFLSSKVRYSVVRLMMSTLMVESSGMFILTKKDLGSS